MRVLICDNVNDALQQGLGLLLAHGETAPSRAGEVLVMPTPVTTVFSSPWKRVLLSAVRDANPFFHLAESLWMLAGREDAVFLNRFVRDFGDRFADDGTIHGAYGYRWRVAFGFDQLEVVVKMLSNDRTSRQGVIQMWDCSVFDGDCFGCDDLRGTWKDRPCNTHIYLRVRSEVEIFGTSKERISYLDITVCCRSNDIIWGAYGANAVHFSVLQEYLAHRIGVKVGIYYQISNNYHAYTAEVERLTKKAKPYGLLSALTPGPYPEILEPVDISENEDIRALLDLDSFKSNSKFLNHVAWPMLRGHELWKNKQQEKAVATVKTTAAADWRQAALEWMGRRR